MCRAGRTRRSHPVLLLGGQRRGRRHRPLDRELAGVQDSGGRRISAAGVRRALRDRRRAGLRHRHPHSGRRVVPGRRRAAFDRLRHHPASLAHHKGSLLGTSLHHLAHRVGYRAGLREVADRDPRPFANEMPGPRRRAQLPQGEGQAQAPCRRPGRWPLPRGRRPPDPAALPHQRGGTDTAGNRQARAATRLFRVSRRG